ncbi:MAG: hypothetical protein QOF43_784 [Gaiellaceae bacterium]|nr:hypothetical protein [Gaiellaceae bacterium]
MSTLETSVLVEINAFRTEHNLPKLHLNPLLTTAAAAHSRQMAEQGYFAHESADGSAFWRRLRGYYSSRRWHTWSVGENLLWSSPDIDGPGALQLWLESPEHRKNLMDRSWREIGVSAVHVAQAPGVYEGQDVTIVTTDFGARS